jgi:hypothetical protein
MNCPKCDKEMAEGWLLGRSGLDYGYAHICKFWQCECGCRVKNCTYVDHSGGKCETSFRA